VKSASAGAPFSLDVLRGTGALWFVIAFSGQLLFAFYTAAFYGGSAVRGDLAAWNDVLFNGRIDGDAAGNAALSAHLALAVIVTAFGPLQLVPQVRNRFPRFHRWNGRLYLFSGVIAAIAGAYLIWTRGALGGLVNQISVTGNAVLIVLFGVIAARHAVKRDFEMHRRWATRFFLVISGVWFFRVMLMGWIIGNGAPVGIGEELNGPVAYALGFAQYLLPLAIHELYWRACDRGGIFAHSGAILMMVAATAATGFGIFGAAVGLWLPRL
jgi:hypothetical protein